MSTDESTELKREIKLTHATAMVVGTIIGASIFVQPAEITGQVPSIPVVLAVWLFSGALTLVGALVCAELAVLLPRTGGVYVYLREAFGPWCGFLWGWAMFWSMHTGIIAAIAVVFARYTGYFVPLGEVGAKGTAIAAIAVLSVVNYVGVKYGSRLQTMFTVGKLFAIVLIIGAGILMGSRLPDHFVAAPSASGIDANDILTAMVAGLFAFGGWHMVTYNAGETIDPSKTIPRALVLGTAIVTVSYIAMNAVYFYVLPLEQVAASSRVAADMADALLGFGGGAVMSGIVMFSTFGALSGIILAGPRVYYSMAKDGLLFPWVGTVHPTFRTPHRAILLQAVWASFLVATGTFRALFTRVIYTEWIFFAAMTVGLFLLRRRNRTRGRYLHGSLPIIGSLFVASAAAIVINQLVSDTRESAVGLALVLLGLPVYYVWSRMSGKGRS